MISPPNPTILLQNLSPDVAYDPPCDSVSSSLRPLTACHCRPLGSRRPIPHKQFNAALTLKYHISATSHQFCSKAVAYDPPCHSVSSSLCPIIACRRRLLCSRCPILRKQCTHFEISYLRTSHQFCSKFEPKFFYCNLSVQANMPQDLYQ